MPQEYNPNFRVKPLGHKSGRKTIMIRVILLRHNPSTRLVFRALTVRKITKLINCALALYQKSRFLGGLQKYNLFVKWRIFNKES